jgi:hypothetical protein
MDTVIDRWSAVGVRELQLKSGTDVRLRIPDVGELHRRGLFPTELEEIVLRWTLGDGFRISELDREGLDAFVAMRDHAIAEAVREIRLPVGEWEPIDLRPYVLDLRIVLPLDDLDDIGMAVLRLKLVDTINAQNRAFRVAMRTVSAVSVDDLPDQDREAAAPVAGDFRGVDPDSAGDAAREDGESVRLPA